MTVTQRPHAKTLMGPTHVIVKMATLEMDKVAQVRRLPSGWYIQWKNLYFEAAALLVMYCSPYSLMAVACVNS